jgi:hypothetical protein
VGLRCGRDKAFSAYLPVRTDDHVQVAIRDPARRTRYSTDAMTGFLSFSTFRVGLPLAFGAALLLFFLAPGSARSQSRYGPFPWTFPSEPDTTLVGHCEHGVAQGFLDIGNVRAGVYNNGNLFWSGGPWLYEVPKDSGVNAIFNANFWIAGLVDGELRVAGSNYGPYEFWPGPIERMEEPPEDCTAWDRIWDVRSSNLLRYEFRPPDGADALRDWPVEAGAPFVDSNRESGYQPDQGDFPAILGDQMLWWVMNDVGNVHTWSHSNPLGLEIRVSAFAFDAFGSLGNTTFYRYEIINRTPKPIENTFAGMFSDVDLGNAWDDYVGSDSTLGMVYVYNSDNDDDLDVNGYGEAPPALGITVIELESSSCRIMPTGLTNSMSWFGGGGPQGNVGSGGDLYNYLQTRWKDGKKVTLGQLGRFGTNIPTSFYMPGDPVEGAFWSAMNMDGEGTKAAPTDQRLLGNFGPIEMDPGEKITITFAFIWSRGSSNLDSVRKLREDAAYIKSLAKFILTPRDPRPRFIDGNPPEDPGYPFSLWAPFPNPASDRVTLQFSSSDPGTIRMEVFDIATWSGGRTNSYR